MENKTKILVFIDFFLPGFKAGGPIKSVANIVDKLYDSFDFYIITSDRDLGEHQPYSNEELNRWIKKEHYKIAYLSEEQRKTFISETLNQRDFDVYYFNSLHSKQYTLKPFHLINRMKSNPNIIIAPRGMLGKGALEIKTLRRKHS